MDKFLELLPYSSKAVLSIFLIALAGVFLVRSKIVSKDSLSVLGKLVMYLFLPCLLFHKISVSASWEKLQTYWVFPMTCVIYIILGLAIGWITVKICKPRTEIRSGAHAAIAFNNSGYIPIALVTGITAIFPVFASDPQAKDKAIAFIAIYLIGYSPLLWTIGYSLISGEKTSKMSIKKFFSPPVIGMLCGLTVAMIQPLSDLFCSVDGFLNPVYRASGIIGEATVPCVLVLLGGCLASGPGRGTVNKRTIFSIILVKLIAFPAIAICYVLLLRYLGALPANMLASVVLVIEASSPPANNLIVMASVAKPETEEGMATIIFWTYLASILTMTMVIVAAMLIFGA